MKITLEYPKTVEGQEIKELEFSRAKAKDVLAATRMAGGAGLEFIEHLAVQLCARAPHELEALDSSDFIEVTEAITELQKFDPDQISQNSSGEFVITLAHPVGDLKLVKLRRPTAGEVIKGSKTGADPQEEIRFVSMLSGLKQEEVLELDAADYGAIQEALKSFFTRSKRRSAVKPPAKQS